MVDKSEEPASDSQLVITYDLPYKMVLCLGTVRGDVHLSFKIGYYFLLNHHKESSSLSLTAWIYNFCDLTYQLNANESNFTFAILQVYSFKCEFWNIQLDIICINTWTLAWPKANPLFSIPKS